MQNFTDRVRNHSEHVKKVGVHCSTEETTKQALILPLLDILGFSPFDPTRVKAEYGADFPGAKASERVDYSLFCHEVPVMFVEAKAYGEKLNNHCPQLARYFNATPEVAIAAITNGREWRFFTDLDNKNMMDPTPFLLVDFEALDDSMVKNFYRFRHDEFKPEALRTLAEETVYLNAFSKVISLSLREPDAEFVRFIASRAGIQRQLNARFLETIAPIVKMAVERSVSEMVVSGLSAKPIPAPISFGVASPSSSAEEPDDPKADIVDPTNPRIVTTYAERRLFEVVREIVGEDVEILPKDTESYFSVLYQGKVNRWLLRLYSDKRNSSIKFCVPMDEARRNEVERSGLRFGAGDNILLPQPEHLMRISGIVFDALKYCQEDGNFKRATAVAAAE